MYYLLYVKELKYFETNKVSRLLTTSKIIKIPLLYFNYFSSNRTKYDLDIMLILLTFLNQNG